MVFALLLVWTAAAAEQHRPEDIPFQASAPGNPFYTDLRGEFSGPDARQLSVPGFYDGEGMWKIRFTPPAAGRWTFRTVSSLPALHGRTGSLEASPNRHAAIHGRLMVDPDFPYHFKFEDGTRFFLMGYEADWLWGADMLDPERKLMNRLIDQISARGFNYVLVNVYAHDTRWCPGKVNEWDFGPAPLYPWEGTNEKPDHSRLNPRFFQVYDGMMRALWAKGIVAHMMIKVYNKAVNWPAKGSADERRYFRYVAARYQAFPNLVWDFSKESFNERDNALQHNLINLVRSEDAYKHLVTLHDDDVYEWDPALNTNIDFRSDQEHRIDWADLVIFDRAHRRRPVVNVEFSYELGVEKLPTHTNVNQVEWPEMLRRAYMIYFAGGYGAYYYNNTAWDIVKPDPEPPGHPRWQILRQIFTSVPWWRLEPHPELSAGARCLAQPGAVYLFYFDREQAAINLTSMPESASSVWVNTWTGDRVPARAGPGTLGRVSKPKEFGGAPAVLVIR